MVTSPLPGIYRLTFADWLHLPDDGRLYEILEGELYVTPPPNIEHRRISRNLEFLHILRSHLFSDLEIPLGEVFPAA